jgi:hypothetical protein
MHSNSPMQVNACKMFFINGSFSLVLVLGREKAGKELTLSGSA